MRRCMLIRRVRLPIRRISTWPTDALARTHRQAHRPLNRPFSMSVAFPPSVELVLPLPPPGADGAGLSGPDQVEGDHGCGGHTGLVLGEPARFGEAHHEVGSSDRDVRIRGEASDELFSRSRWEVELRRTSVAGEVGPDPFGCASPGEHEAGFVREVAEQRRVHVAGGASARLRSRPAGRWGRRCAGAGAAARAVTPRVVLGAGRPALAAAPMTPEERTAVQRDALPNGPGAGGLDRPRCGRRTSRCAPAPGAISWWTADGEPPSCSAASRTEGPATAIGTAALRVGRRSLIAGSAGTAIGARVREHVGIASRGGAVTASGLQRSFTHEAAGSIPAPPPELIWR